MVVREDLLAEKRIGVESCTGDSCAGDLVIDEITFVVVARSKACHVLKGREVAAVCARDEKRARNAVGIRISGGFETCQRIKTVACQLHILTGTHQRERYGTRLHGLGKFRGRVVADVRTAMRQCALQIVERLVDDVRFARLIGKVVVPGQRLQYAKYDGVVFVVFGRHRARRGK